MALVELARFDTRIEADLARLLLESEGVDAILFDAEMNSFGWGPMMPVRLMVLEEDRDLAQQLLGEDGP
jgi:putative signal transducing protein